MITKATYTGYYIIEPDKENLIGSYIFGTEKLAKSNCSSMGKVKKLEVEVEIEEIERERPNETYIERTIL
jgi:hypothetical protein